MGKPRKRMCFIDSEACLDGVSDLQLFEFVKNPYFGSLLILEAEVL